MLTAGEVTILMVLTFYAVLLGLTFDPGLASRLSPVLKPSLEVSVPGLLAVMAWRSALTAPNGRLHLSLLDASAAGRSGEAILMWTPSGRYRPVNRGPSARSLSDGQGRRLALLDRRRTTWWWRQLSRAPMAPEVLSSELRPEQS